MTFVQTDNALKPNGHYSQAIIHDNLIYLSGILPFHKETGSYVEGNLKKQMLVVLDNLDCILQAAGTDKYHVIKTVVYIPDITLWPEANDLYSQYFGPHRPVRSIVPTNTLHFNSNIEMEVIACIE